MYDTFITLSSVYNNNQPDKYNISSQSTLTSNQNYTLTHTPHTTHNDKTKIIKILLIRLPPFETSVNGIRNTLSYPNNITSSLP